MLRFGSAKLGSTNWVQRKRGMNLLSIQVGMPRVVSWQGKAVETGIFKESTSGPIWAGKTGLNGDGQANLSVHGGIDKAVYAFGADAYEWWKERFPQRAWKAGMMGENLTVDALDESTLAVGDRFILGEAELEVSEPRFPCFKLGIRLEDESLVKVFEESLRPGVYFRVVREGMIQPGTRFYCVHRSEQRLSITDLFKFRVEGFRDLNIATQILQSPAIPPRWRERVHSHFPELAPKAV